MRNAFLVALREYGENAKTKGFWIGILAVPVMIYASIFIQIFLAEKAIPVRYFTLVDQSGEFDAVVDEGIERLYQRKVFEAVGKYVQKHALEPEGGQEVDLEQVPASAMDPQQMIEEFASNNAETVDQLMQPGGLEAMLAALRPGLQPDAPEFEPPSRPFVRVPVPPEVEAGAAPKAVSDALKPYLVGDVQVATDDGERELFAAVIIPEDILERLIRPDQPLAQAAALAGGEEEAGVRFWTTNLADTELRNAIENSVNGEIRRRAYAEHGVDQATVREIDRTRVPIESYDPKKAEGEEKVSAADVIRQWAPVGFVYLLYIAIFITAGMLLQNTIEEKSNRIIEVLVSSVTPGELMMGKLMGIAAVGLTMVVAWMASTILILKLQSSPELEFASSLLEVLSNDRLLLPAFAVYFLLGYLFYAGVFLAVGSVCNTLKEAQNFMGPVNIVLMVPLITMMFIPRDPNGTLATVLSWIPLYTPFIMMNRAAADPPMRDLAGTFLMMAACAVGMLWLSGKVFRIGILRTGQPPKFREMLRWLWG